MMGGNFEWSSTLFWIFFGHSFMLVKSCTDCTSNCACFAGSFSGVTYGYALTWSQWRQVFHFEKQEVLCQNNRGWGHWKTTQRSSTVSSCELLITVAGVQTVNVHHCIIRVHVGQGDAGKSGNFEISFSLPGESWIFIVGHGKSWKILFMEKYHRKHSFRE